MQYKGYIYGSFIIVRDRFFDSNFVFGIVFWGKEVGFGVFGGLVQIEFFQ